MKKVVSVLLAVIMLFALAACSGDGKTTTSPSPSASVAPSSDTTTSPDASPAESDPSGSAAAGEPIKAGEGWDIVNAAGDDVIITASSVSKDLAEKAGVSTIGWSSDDVDWFARDAYKICYMRMGTMAIHVNFVDAIKKDWEPRLNFKLDEYDANNEINRMMDAIETYALQGYDGLMIDPDVTVGQRTMELCAELNMPWMPAWNPVTDENNVRIYPGVSLDSIYCGNKQTQWLGDNYKTYWGDIDTTKLGMIFIYASFNENFIQNEEGAKETFIEMFPEAAANYYIADCISEATPVSAEAGYNTAGAIMSAHPEVEHWFIATCLEDYGQGAARVAEAQNMADRVLVCTNGANILIPAWQDGSESGSCWVAGLHYGMNMFAEPIVCGLIALIDGRATPDTLFIEWKQPGELAANVRCDWRIVCEKDYQDYLDYIDAYLAA